jgi:hypothetical protein
LSLVSLSSVRIASRTSFMFTLVNAASPFASQSGSARVRYAASQRMPVQCIDNAIAPQALSSLLLRAYP